MPRDATGVRARRIGLVGHGAIGRAVASRLLSGAVPTAGLVAILEQDAGRREAAARLAEGRDVLVTGSPEHFLACDLALVVEVAGQGAVRELAEAVLRRGRDLLVVSTGAFTDDELYARLSEVAARTGGRLLLAAGALPAVDWLQAAALAPVHNLTITQIKPVRSWLGTAAETLVDLRHLREPTPFFEGTAREAARTFPKSSNITATLALATVGLDKTRVRLVADPTADGMRTLIAFRGEAGVLTVEWQGVPSATNLSTSADVPLAVLKAMRNWSAPVVVGV